MVLRGGTEAGREGGDDNERGAQSRLRHRRRPTPAANGSGGHLASARREARLTPPPSSVRPTLARARLGGRGGKLGLFPAPLANARACAVAVAFGRSNEQNIWRASQES